MQRRRTASGFVVPEEMHSGISKVTMHLIISSKPPGGLVLELSLENFRLVKQN